jgi:hypothetical protein
VPEKESRITRLGSCRSQSLTLTRSIGYLIILLAFLVLGSSAASALARPLPWTRAGDSSGLLTRMRNAIELRTWELSLGSCWCSLGCACLELRLLFSPWRVLHRCRLILPPRSPLPIGAPFLRSRLLQCGCQMLPGDLWHQAICCCQDWWNQAVIPVIISTCCESIEKRLFEMNPPWLC